MGAAGKRIGEGSPSTPGRLADRGASMRAAVNEAPHSLATAASSSFARGAELRSVQKLGGTSDDFTTIVKELTQTSG